MKRMSIVALLVLTGCAKNVTEVALTVEAGSQIRAMTGAVHLVVRGGPASGTGYDDPPAIDVDIPVGSGASRAFPLHVAVAPQNGDASRRWSIEASALQSGTQTVLATARVRGSYVDHRSLAIELVLEDACLGTVCGADQTCRGGSCVDSTYVPEVDAGVVGDAGVDANLPRHCPSADVYAPDAAAGSLNDDAGVAPTYLPLEACNPTHTRGLACPSSTHPDDVCFTERQQPGLAFCRVPCGMDDPDGGAAILDEARCQQIHPDSHCEGALGADPDLDGYYCSVPCNPIDDVGCPNGTRCALLDSYERARLYTACWAPDPDPGHQLEPCGVDGPNTSPVLGGCGVGYRCTWESICGSTTDQGYVCAQLCDLDPYAPRLGCPAGSSCAGMRAPPFDDLYEGMHVGVCRPN